MVAAGPSVGPGRVSIDTMNRQWALVLTTALSVAGAALCFFVGLGAGLSEDPDYWFFWLLATVFAVVAGLSDFARRRG